MDHRSLVMRVAAVAALWLGAATSPAHAQDQAARVLDAAREALGGQTLASVRSLSLTGEFRRMFGERELNGEVTIDLEVPGRIKRVEEMGIPGGPAMVRTTALDGDQCFEDTTSRGGGGFMRFGGPGGPGAPGGPGGQPSEADRERFRQMQQRRLTSELHRLLLAFLLQTDAPVTYVGTAQAEDGSADVLEILSPDTRPIRLYLDQQTHLPLMLTYEGVQPRMFTRQGRPGGPPPDPEEMKRRMAEPPQQVTFEVRFSDYKRVNGVLLPHLVVQSTDGRPEEEWTISRVKVNPSFKADAFRKK